MLYVISGSRDYTDLEEVRTYIRNNIHDQDVVFHGNARGVDRVAGKQAEIQGAQVEIHPALWEEHGKAAGVIRNEEMLDDAIDTARALFTEVKGLVWWDGKSRGTSHMIDLMKKHKIPINLFRNEGDK